MAKQLSLRNALFAACFGTLFLFVSTSDDGRLAEIEAQIIVKNDVPAPVISRQNESNGVVVPPNPSSGNYVNHYTGAKEAKEPICTQTRIYRCGDNCCGGRHVAKYLETNPVNDYTGAKEAEEPIYTQKEFYSTGEKHIANDLKGAYKDREGKTVQYDSRYKKQLENSNDPKNKQYKGLKGAVNS